MGDIKYMEGKDFQRLGYLQESNRQFFHPLGLALEMHSGWTKEDLDEFLGDNGVQFGRDAQDNIWTFIRLLGLDGLHISPQVWDYREDPDGNHYGAGTLDREKSLYIERMQNKRRPLRMAMAGYWIQPNDPEQSCVWDRIPVHEFEEGDSVLHQVTYCTTHECGMHLDLLCGKPSCPHCMILNEGEDLLDTFSWHRNGPAEEDT